jgi:hypothetical protein
MSDYLLGAIFVQVVGSCSDKMGKLGSDYLAQVL